MTSQPTEKVDLNINRLDMQQYKYIGCISGKIAKWDKHIDVQINSADFKPSDPNSIMSYVHSFKTACDSNGIHGGTAMWLFQYFIANSAKAVLARRVSASREAIPE